MKKIISSLLLIYLFSCDTGKEPNLTFDLSQWKKDKNACQSFRENHSEEMIEIKEVFNRWPERQISSFLGRPDRHRLSKRHQKFYVYFLENGKQCNDSYEEYGRFLQIRFDATGYVNEIEIRRDFEQLID